MISVFRRHTDKCPHQSKGRSYLKCQCPLWADGYENGKRSFFQSLKTRDLARARKKILELENPDSRKLKPVSEAVGDFLQRCEGDGLAFATYRKYRNSLNQLRAFCERERVDYIDEIGVEELDGFRGGRRLKPITASKELQLLRGFCGFCMDRGWTKINAAKAIKSPKNIKPNSVEPFSPLEVSSIISASGEIGQQPYERLRAAAMVMALRYTALRLGDVALLKKDRLSWNGSRWKVFLRTAKNGKPVFLPVPIEMKEALDSVPPPKGKTTEWQYYFWNGVSSERSMKKNVDDTLRSVFRKSGVTGAHAHRFRHTLATEMLEHGASFEEVADVLGNTPEVVREHYQKWSPKRQDRIDELLEKVHSKATYTKPKLRRIK